MANAKWNTDATVRAGEAMLKLAEKYREQLEPRLPSALIDGLAADLDALRTDAADAIQSRAAKKGATKGQNDALAQGATLVSGIRAAIRHRYRDDKKAQTDFGVGLDVQPRRVSSVTAALQTVLKAADANPDRVRAAAILPSDLDVARSALAALTEADKVQEGHKVNAKTATARRAATQARVEEAVHCLIGAASIAFALQPEVASLFTSVVPTKRTSKAAAAKTPAA